MRRSCRLMNLRFSDETRPSRVSTLLRHTAVLTLLAFKTADLAEDGSH